MDGHFEHHVLCTILKPECIVTVTMISGISTSCHPVAKHMHVFYQFNVVRK